MAGLELKDSMDKQNMLNMLIIDLSPYYNPLVTNLTAVGSRRSAPLGILIREDGRIQEEFGENRHVVEEETEQVVPELSKHLESVHGKNLGGVCDKGKKKLVDTEMPHQNITSPQILGVGIGFQVVTGQEENCSNIYVDGPSMLIPNLSRRVHYSMKQNM